MAATTTDVAMRSAGPSCDGITVRSAGKPRPDPTEYLQPKTANHGTQSSTPWMLSPTSSIIIIITTAGAHGHHPRSKNTIQSISTDETLLAAHLTMQAHTLSTPRPPQRSPGEQTLGDAPSITARSPHPHAPGLSPDGYADLQSFAQRKPSGYSSVGYELSILLSDCR